MYMPRLGCDVSGSQISGAGCLDHAAITPKAGRLICVCGPAPSPSPLLSAMQSEVESRQIGSPYPYPFTHIRRSTMPSMQQAPSSTPDLNNPDYIREQMARQWQMYALNNGFQLSSEASTFSPPGTP